MKNYTSLEQSKRLIDAGLDPNTADMAWIYEDMIEDYSPNMGLVPIQEEDFPCWSVGALIQLMPEDLAGYELMINSKCVRYYDYEEWHALIWFDTSDGNLTECCVKTILWLLEKGHIKKGE